VNTHSIIISPAELGAILYGEFVAEGLSPDVASVLAVWWVQVCGRVVGVC
jgi:hypothetical protein